MPAADRSSPVTTWPCPSVGGGTCDEYAYTLDRGRAHRLLVVPALFDEANRLRRLTVETMRALDAVGIDTFLPDLPGCNESLQPLGQMSLPDWRTAILAAADHFRTTHVLALRGGTLVAPDLPGWHYVPVKGASLLRQMIRARILASREAGRSERQEGLLEQGRKEGLVLAGHDLSATMIVGLEQAEPHGQAEVIGQDRIGGGALWLRAEASEDAAQVQALCSVVAGALQI